MNSFSRADRAWGALLGCAVGDAMGMPTEMMSIDDIEEVFPNGIDRFYPSSERDLFGRSMKAGTVTDDTVNTVLVAEMYISSGGSIDPKAYIDGLMAWVDEHRTIADLVVGPSTRRALESIERGMPIERAGIFGVTNGAAMKISPVGIVRDYRHLISLVDEVECICIPTHNTSPAIACASAIATAVSYGVRGGDSIYELWEVALDAAREGARRGYNAPSPDVVGRLESVQRLAFSEGSSAVISALRHRFGTGMSAAETAPAALAVVTLADGDPMRAASIAATLGGDTDTIGSIASSICGAMRPVFTMETAAFIDQVNGLDLRGLAERLAAVSD
ncbi:ADP-ribosylglycohydrolase family protein [Collinsella vaginalis]|uniref:ADP-ribosylglycohydrolase family protein n=1 Tax=Collinsella vaginalis TaxID=1870987 RepID=UPI000A26988C|nr:ADP-ribosylglycohydrolase family protein [Collinsella vaginalis]